MGLLDVLTSGTPQANMLGQGLLGMGAGLLQGGAYGALGPSLGQGLLGFQAGEQNAQQNEMQQQYLGARSALLQQQVNLAKQHEANGLGMLRAVLGGASGSNPPIAPPSGGLLGNAPATSGGLLGNAAPSVPSGGILADSGATAYPASSPGAPSAPAAAPAMGPGFTLSPSQKLRAAVDYYFNGGKGIPDILKPNVKFINGVAFDMNSVKPGSTVPIISRNGMAIEPVVNADGSISVKAAPGSVDAYSKFRNADEAATASHDLVKTVGPDGNTIYQTREQIIQGTQGIKPAVASRNPITQSSQIKLNDNFVTNDYQPTVTEGTAARDMLSNINAMRSIPITTGWGSDAQAAAANVLASMGLASDKVNQYASNAQAFRSIAMAQVNKVLNLAKGPQTDQDARRAQQTFASLQNTPQANAFILDYAQAAADMRARKAAYYQQMLPYAQKSGDLTRISREWQKVQGSIWNDPVMDKWRKEQ